MAKFTFPIPGRKKQAPPVSSAEPLTKAQRILGSTQVTTEPSKPWDTASSSGISVSVSESTAPTTNGSTRGYGRRLRPEREWGDESEVVPRHLRSNEPFDRTEDLRSEYTSVLREQASSSTIKSWYDKTRQPLSVSQQTSASAMAKGLPPKAQRLLDMDNAYSMPPPMPANKGKKKPATLDLSQIKPGSRGKDNDWEAPVLGNDYVTRSPSILSPVSPSSKRPRRRIQKRPTHESLKQRQDDGNSRPGTSGNQSQHSQQNTSKLDELPSLYKHYEQMSFAQVMDDGEEPVRETLRTERDPEKVARLPGVLEEAIPSVDYYPQSQRQRDGGIPGPLSSHPTVSHSSNSSYSTQRSHPTHLSHPAQSNIAPQVFHPPLPIKGDPQSPIDCAASISSRHTRTSKASRRTDKSFQTADLQEKSVLMLSSDSEEDDEADSYTETSTNNTVSTAPATRRPSPSDSVNPHLVVADDTQSLQSRQSTLTCKRMSSAPAGFLTIPPRFSCQAPSPAPSTSLTNIQESSQPTQAAQIPESPSGVSLSTTNSSVSTAMTWQSREGYGVQEARAVTMVSAQGPEPDSEQDTTDSDLEYDEPKLVVRRESTIPTPLNAAEPTPPLSPNPMDHYMQSPESLEGAHAHYMGLTRQEQMLIQALRQRRELMRKSSLTLEEEDLPQPQQQPPRKGHKSNPSEATITEATFNFGFPAPPTNKEMGPRDCRLDSTMSSTIDLPIPGTNDDDAERCRSPACTADGTMFVLSPPPSSHHKPSRSILRNPSVCEQPSLGARRSHVPPPLNHAVSPDLGINETLPKSKTMGFEKPSPPRAKPRDSLTIPRSHGSVRRQRSTLDRRESKSRRDRLPARDLQFQSCHIMEDPPTAPLPLPPRQRRPQVDDEPGIPRPDSPISPMADAFPVLPAKRHTLNNQKARLSAFGPPQANGDFGWWGDHD